MSNFKQRGFFLNLIYFFTTGLFLLLSVSVRARNDTIPPRPVLPGLYADPNIVVFGHTYYIYPTTDGFAGWQASSFTCWSSNDLVNWVNRGIVLDLPKDISWAKSHAWAPTIAFKNGKYFFYYSADGNIGVAVGDSPAGPFKDPLGKPLIKKGLKAGQMIDPMVFMDDDGSAYLYWGQGECHAVKLNSDMISCDTSKILSFKPEGYNEGPFMIKRKGIYYLMWSEFDTRDPRYSIAYATGTSPLGPFTRSAGPSILKGKGLVKGAGHHSVVQVPGTDIWVIAYHRFKIPGGDGYHREVCLSPMRFDKQGNILPVNVYEPVSPIKSH